MDVLYSVHQLLFLRFELCRSCMKNTVALGHCGFIVVYEVIDILKGTKLSLVVDLIKLGLD